MPSSNKSSPKSSGGEDVTQSTPPSRASTQPSTQPSSSPIPIPHPVTADMLGANLRRKRTRDEDDEMMNLPPQRTPATSPTSYYDSTIARRDPLTGQATFTEGQTALTVGTIEEHLEDGLRDMPRVRDSEEEARNLPTAMAAGSTNVNGTSPPEDTRAGNGPEEPRVDDMTRLIGIGWRRPSPAMQGSARGWARFIETNYPFVNVEIMALNSREEILVRTREGIFLFSEDLREGELLAGDLDGAIRRLQTPNRHFERAHLFTPTPQANTDPGSGERHSAGESSPAVNGGVDLDTMEMD